MRLVHVHYWISLFGLHSLFQIKRRLHRVHCFLRGERALILLQLYDLFTLTVLLWIYLSVFFVKIKFSEIEKKKIYLITSSFHSPKRDDDFLHSNAHVWFDADSSDLICSLTVWLLIEDCSNDMKVLVESNRNSVDRAYRARLHCWTALYRKACSSKFLSLSEEKEIRFENS